MDSVFVLQHSYQLNDESSSEETKLIGIYSTRAIAEMAIERLKKQPGFKDLPEYFSIEEYQIDQDNWTEGFASESYVPIYSVWCTSASGDIKLVKSGLVEADALRLVRDLENENQANSYWAKEHA